MRVLPSKWRRKPAGIDMERSYVILTLCMLQCENGRTDRKPVWEADSHGLKEPYLRWNRDP